MRVYVVMCQERARGDDAPTCPVVETVRYSLEEAEAYISGQEVLYEEFGDDTCRWYVEEHEMPLAYAREAVTP